MFFDEMQVKGLVPDVPVFTTLIAGHLMHGKNEEASNFKSKMIESAGQLDLYAYTSLVEACFKVVDVKNAIGLFREMQNSGIVPTHVRYLVLIDGLCKSGSVQEAVNHFRDMVDTGLSPNVVIYNALIDGFCKSNFLGRASELFNEMQAKGLVPDVATFTALISGNLKVGNVEKAFQLKEKMMVMGLELDLQAYTCIIHGLPASRLEDARMLFDEMISKGVRPNKVVYGLLVRKYFDLGRADEASKLQEDMINNGFMTETGDFTAYNTATPNHRVE